MKEKANELANVGKVTGNYSLNQLDIRINLQQKILIAFEI